MEASKLPSAVDLTYSDPNFIRGSKAFEFPNGDTYDGQYCAHRSGVIWREGIGTYRTKDGQSYSGVWMDDKLIDGQNIEITYPNGYQYCGNMVKNKYTGSGMYIFDEDIHLLCDFVDNKPAGNLLLIDKKGKEWHGVAAENDALLLPDHMYFHNISKDRGKGKRKKPPRPKLFRPPTRETEKTSECEQVDKNALRDLELKIFAKTKKTLSDLKFEDSDWYKNYMDFKKIHDDIVNKIQRDGEKVLSSSEQEWYRKYKSFKEKYLDVLDAKKKFNKKLSDHKLFELFNSEQYRNSCPPVPVFYPSQHDNANNEASGED